MNRKENNIIHLLIRFSDNLFSTGDTIENHQIVLKSQGAVWFGKLGTPIAQRHIDAINSQCQTNIPTFLILVKGNRKRSTYYRAKIIILSSISPKGEDELIPKYYFDINIVERVRFWAKISDIVLLENQEVNALKVISSVNDIRESVARSASGHFLIHINKPA